jgi:hypothetical protein
LELLAKKIGYLKKYIYIYEIWRIRGSLSKFSRSKKSKEFAPKKHALLVLAYSQKYEGCLKNFHFYILFIAKFG